MKKIVTDVSKQIIRDSLVGLHARGSHIGVFDISGELPVIRSAAYAVETTGDGHKSVVWLMRLGYDKKRPHSYMVIDHVTIRETMTQNEHGYIDQMPVEPWLGHGYFNMWWKHRQVAEVSRNFDVRVPTFKSYSEMRGPNNILYMIGLPIYRIIAAAVIVNVLTYKDRNWNRADCINAFFNRFPSLEKHRHQVEKVVFGKWLDPIVDSYDRGRTPLNVNKLTGL